MVKINILRFSVNRFSFLMYNGNMKNTIEKLSPSDFRYENYETNPFCRFGVDWDLNLNKVLKDKILDSVLGWCEADNIPVRPRLGEYVVMCEDENFEKFWFHVGKETIDFLKQQIENELSV